MGYQNAVLNKISKREMFYCHLLVHPKKKSLG